MSSPSRHGTTATFDARERWLLAGASFWLVGGLQLDAFDHATTSESETSWTPWQAVLYSGIAACGLVLVWLVRPRLPPAPTHRSLDELPREVRLPLLGLALLLIGGAIDIAWHSLFGIEKGLEIYFSPGHFFIVIGMVLVACGPALMTAGSGGRQLHGGDAALVLMSALLAMLPTHVFTQHASALEQPLLGTGDPEMHSLSLDAQMLHGYIGSTVLLLLPVLVISRRWEVPVGTPTVLVAVPALAMVLIMGDPSDVWLPLVLTVATAVVEAYARVIAPLLRRLSEDTRWLLLGFVAPAVVWGAVLAAGALVVGVGWPVHMVTGLVLATALTGLATAFLVRRVQVTTGPTAVPV